MGASGRLIVFEGGEGSGKSTQARLLAEARGALLTREPGGTPFGEAIRSLLLERTDLAIDPYAELLLMVASRAQHVAELIGPTLRSGRDVVCDRYSGSTLAYQGYGRGLPMASVARACELGEAGVHADLTVFLDVPLGVAFARLPLARDRIEGEDADFHARVVDGYRNLATEDPHGWVVIDGAGSKDEVHARVKSAIRTRLDRAPDSGSSR